MLWELGCFFLPENIQLKIPQTLRRKVVYLYANEWQMHSPFFKTQLKPQHLNKIFPKCFNFIFFLLQLTSGSLSQYHSVYHLYVLSLFYNLLLQFVGLLFNIISSLRIEHMYYFFFLYSLTTYITSQTQMVSWLTLIKTGPKWILSTVTSMV